MKRSEAEILHQYIEETTMPNVRIGEKQRPTGELKLEIPLEFDTLVAKSEKDKKFSATFNTLTRHVFVSPNEDNRDYTLVIKNEVTPDQVKDELDDPAFRRQIQTLIEKIQIEKDKKSGSEELLSRLNTQLISVLEEKEKILEELREILSSPSKKGEKASVLKEQLRIYNKEIPKLQKDIEIRKEIYHDLDHTVRARIASIEKLAIQLGESIGLKRMK